MTASWRSRNHTSGNNLPDARDFFCRRLSLRGVTFAVSADSSVQVGLAGRAVWVRVSGRGTFQNSAGLKQFAAEMTRRGHREFVVDLENCEMMDSTFLGTLAGIALAVGPEGSLTVARPNARNRDVLQNLGLDRIFTVSDQAPSPYPGAMKDAAPQKARRETIVEAHENLAAANPENAIRFKDVLEFLQHKEG
jgi:anti-sigma B factor antagonist